MPGMHPQAVRVSVFGEHWWVRTVSYVPYGSKYLLFGSVWGIIQDSKYLLRKWLDPEGLYIYIFIYIYISLYIYLYIYIFIYIYTTQVFPETCGGKLGYNLSRCKDPVVVKNCPLKTFEQNLLRKFAPFTPWLRHRSA